MPTRTVYPSFITLKPDTEQIKHINFERLEECLPLTDDAKAKEKLESAFKTGDAGGNGKLSVTEIQKVLVDALRIDSITLRVIAPALQRAFRAASGCSRTSAVGVHDDVTLEEFALYVEFFSYELKVLKAYHPFANRSGFSNQVVFEDFAVLMPDLATKHNVSISKNIEEEFELLDADGGGIGRYDEFSSYLLRKGFFDPPPALHERRENAKILTDDARRRKISRGKRKSALDSVDGVIELRRSLKNRSRKKRKDIRTPLLTIFEDTEIIKSIDFHYFDAKLPPGDDPETLKILQNAFREQKSQKSVALAQIEKGLMRKLEFGSVVRRVIAPSVKRAYRAARVSGGKGEDDLLEMEEIPTLVLFLRFDLRILRVWGGMNFDGDKRINLQEFCVGFKKLKNVLHIDWVDADNHKAVVAEYHKIDKDGGGFITYSEFASYAIEAGAGNPPDEVKRLAAAACGSNADELRAQKNGKLQSKQKGNNSKGSSSLAKGGLSYFQRKQKEKKLAASRLSSSKGARAARKIAKPTKTSTKQQQRGASNKKFGSASARFVAPQPRSKKGKSIITPKTTSSKTTPRNRLARPKSARQFVAPQPRSQRGKGKAPKTNNSSTPRNRVARRPESARSGNINSSGKQRPRSAVVKFPKSAVRASREKEPKNPWGKEEDEGDDDGANPAVSQLSTDVGLLLSGDGKNEEEEEEEEGDRNSDDDDDDDDDDGDALEKKKNLSSETDHAEETRQRNGSELQAQVLDLESRNSKLASRIADLEGEVDKAREKRLELQKRLENSNSFLLQQKIRDLEREIMEEKAEKETLQKKLRVALRDRSEAYEHAGDGKADFALKLVAREAEISELRRINSKLEMKLEEQNKEQQKKDGRITGGGEQVAGLEAIISGLNMENQKLHKKVANADKGKKELMAFMERKLGGVRKENEALKTELLRAKGSALREASEKYCVEIEELKAQLEREIQAVVKWKQKAKSAEGNLKEMEESVSSSRKEKSSMSKEIAAASRLRRQVRNLVQSNEEKCSEVRQLEEEIRKLKARRPPPAISQYYSNLEGRDHGDPHHHHQDYSNRSSSSSGHHRNASSASSGANPQRTKGGEGGGGGGEENSHTLPLRREIEDLKFEKKALRNEMKEQAAGFESKVKKIKLEAAEVEKARERASSLAENLRRRVDECEERKLREIEKAAAATERAHKLQREVARYRTEPIVRRFQALQDRLRSIEDVQKAREDSLQQMVEKEHNRLIEERERFERQLAAKDANIRRYRGELDTLLRALRRIKASKSHRQRM